MGDLPYRVPEMKVTVEHWDGKAVTETMDMAYFYDRPATLELDGVEFVRAGQRLGGQAAAKLLRAVNDLEVLKSFKLARPVRDRERGAVARLINGGFLNHCPELWGQVWAKLSPDGARELERAEMEETKLDAQRRHEKAISGQKQFAKRDDYDLNVLERYRKVRRIDDRELDALDRLYHKGLVRVWGNRDAEVTQTGREVLAGLKTIPYILDVIKTIGKVDVAWRFPVQDGREAGETANSTLPAGDRPQIAPERAETGESSTLPALDKWLIKYLAAIRTVGGYRLPEHIHDFDLKYLQSLGYVEYVEKIDTWYITGKGIAYLESVKSQLAGQDAIHGTGRARIIGDGEFILRLIASVGRMNEPFTGYEQAWGKLEELSLIGYSAKDGAHVLTGAGHLEIARIFKDFPKGTVERENYHEKE